MVSQVYNSHSIMAPITDERFDKICESISFEFPGNPHTDIVFLWVEDFIRDFYDATSGKKGEIA